MSGWRPQEVDFDQDAPQEVITGLTAMLALYALMHDASTPLDRTMRAVLVLLAGFPSVTHLRSATRVQRNHKGVPCPGSSSRAQVGLRVSTQSLKANLMSMITSKIIRSDWRLLPSSALLSPQRWKRHRAQVGRRASERAAVQTGFPHYPYDR